MKLNILDGADLWGEFPRLKAALDRDDFSNVIAELRQASNVLMDARRHEAALQIHRSILSALPEASEPEELRLWCLLGIGNAQFHSDNDAAAREAYETMRDGARAIDDGYLESVALSRLGDLAQKLEQANEAEEYYSQSIERKLAIGDYIGVVENLVFLTILREAAGDLDRVQRTLKVAEQILRRVARADMRRAIPPDRLPEYAETIQYWEMALWFQQASLKRTQKDDRAAMRLSRKALKAARERNDRPAEAKLLQNIANDLVALGRGKEAMPLYAESLRIAEQHDLRDTVEQVQLCTAIALFRRKRFAESVPFYQAAATSAKERGDVAKWASLNADTGAALLAAGQVDDGASLLRESLSYFREATDATWQESILSNWLLACAKTQNREGFDSQLHQGLDGLPQGAFRERHRLFQVAGNLLLYEFKDVNGAARYYKQAVEEDRAAGRDADAGQTAAIAATQLSESSAYQNALSLFDMATEIFEMTGDFLSLWKTRNDRGICLTNRGFYEEAFEDYQWCLTEAKERDNRVLAAQAHLNLGETYRRTGDIDKAIQTSSEALSLYQSMEDLNGEADAHNTMGLSLLEERRLGGADRSEEAAPHFERALELANAANNRAQAARANRGLAHVLESRGNTAQALYLFEKAARLWEREGDDAHCVEALAAHIALQGRHFNLRRFQRSLAKMLPVAIRAGAVGTAARGIIGAAGHLSDVGDLRSAAMVSFLALDLNRFQSASEPRTRDQDATEEAAQEDLFDILLYIVDLMVLRMAREQTADFLAYLTNPKNFNDPADRETLLSNIELVYAEEAASGRYDGSVGEEHDIRPELRNFVNAKNIWRKAL